MTTKNHIFKRYLSEYLRADRKRKGEILEAVCDVTGIHRKAAIRKFKVLQLKDSSGLKKRGRKAYYTLDVTLALKDLWEASSEICGELLHPMVKEYVDILKRDKMWSHSKETTEKLLIMSEITVKRRVGKFLKDKNFRRGLSSTKPSQLKEIIPIFTGPWEGKGPGYGQIDTVVHCGGSLKGDMVFSVNYTDVATLWVSFRAQWNKGQQATRDSLKKIKGKVPFPILGMHPDTGSEFVNWFLKEWCDEENIELTRSRPNHKNDNAYVEQKNGHVVRRFLGYDRIDNKDVIEVMNELYDKLELYLNHFVASRKCLEKVRIGSKYKRKYDKAKTPYQRVLEHKDIDPEIKARLTKEHETLNPLILKKEIDNLIEEIFNRQKNHGNSSL
jgi:hypothetical protein